MYRLLTTILFVILLVCHSELVQAQSSASAVKTIPFQYIDHIFLQTELNGGREATLVYDPIRNIILDRRFVREWGIPTYGGAEVGYGGPVRVGGGGGTDHLARFAREVEMQVADETFDFPVVSIVPLDSMMATALGRHVDGLFGINVLAGYVLEFDFAREHFVLHDPAAFEVPPGYTELPITRMEQSRRPTIAATLTLSDGSNVPAHFLLDFGMGSTVRLTTRFVDEQNLLERLAPQVSSDAERGLGGALQSVVTRLPAMAMGGLVVEDVVTSLARETSGADADRAWDGLIGLGLLDRFHLYLDLQEDRLWLKPKARFDRPFIFVQTGLGFEVPDPSYGGLRIAEVTEGSVADEAGLRAGDTIVDVEGVSTAGWNRADWSRALEARVGSSLGLAVQRAGQRLAMELPVRDALARD